MLKSKFSRHAFSFILIAVSSASLYITAKYDLAPASFILLGLVVAAHLFTLLAS